MRRDDTKGLRPDYVAGRIERYSVFALAEREIPYETPAAEKHANSQHELRREVDTFLADDSPAVGFEEGFE